MGVRCLLVDDDHNYLLAARYLLEREGIDVAGTASTGAEARRDTVELRPDVVLLDIELGLENGFDVARDITSGEPSEHPPIILISSYSEDDFADILEDSPARGFLPKDQLSGEAIRGILTAASTR
jgi:DNA-binding NarL/FixJ family response regulator